MDDMSRAPSPAGPSATTSRWEQGVDATFAWLPYASLAVSVVLAYAIVDGTAAKLVAVALSAAAAIWTFAAFTRLGPPTRVAQPALRIYMIGFLALATALVLRHPVFLVYALTGFFHASLLRPWSLAFVAIGATSAIVHSHIVLTESTPGTWAIYAGVVVIQAGAVAAGLYAGERILEVAEERRATVHQLEAAIAENEGLHAQLVAQAREAGVHDERQRMAREIHDTIAQGLTGVITQLEAAQHSWDDQPAVARRIDTAARLARDSLSEARRSVQAIRPGLLDGSRLPDALREAAQRWTEVSGVPVQVQCAGPRRALRPEIEVTLLRAAQEALANVAKHAAASRVGLTLTFMDDSVALDVRDDGSGFDVAAVPSEASFGLAAMRQRVGHVHGELLIESAPGEGTALSVRVPTGYEEADDG